MRAKLIENTSDFKRSKSVTNALDIGADRAFKPGDRIKCLEDIYHTSLDLPTDSFFTLGEIEARYSKIISDGEELHYDNHSKGLFWDSHGHHFIDFEFYKNHKYMFERL